MTVFNFGGAQSLKQLKANRASLLQVLDNIRSTLTRLFQTGLIFHISGSHAARLMLEAQEQLTEVLDAIDQLKEEDERDPDQIRSLQATLNRVGDLTAEAATHLKKAHPNNP